MTNLAVKFFGAEHFPHLYYVVDRTLSHLSIWVHQIWEHDLENFNAVFLIEQSHFHQLVEHFDCFNDHQIFTVEQQTQQ